jgi:hypothetical protein
MLYHSAPDTVPNGYRLALVWRLTCPETGRVTLATETRHKIRTRGTHRFFALIASPRATAWLPSGDWDAQRGHLDAQHVGFALVHYGDDDAARMAHAAALDDAGRDAAPPRTWDAWLAWDARREAAGGACAGDVCEACEGDGEGPVADTARGPVGGACPACDGEGHAPASPLPPRRWTSDEQPVHDAPHAPAAPLYEVEIPSSSRAGVAYTVTHDAQGWHCTCPHHRYRRAVCKHIDAARIARRRPAALAVAA